MEKERLFRVAAIVYADESKSLNPRAIHNKIIQSVFVNNSNQRLSIHSLIDLIKNDYCLDFIEEEILEIIKKGDHKSYDIAYQSNRYNPTVCLSSKRYQYLLEKTEKKDIKVIVDNFTKTKYKGDLKSSIVEETIYRFLYELLNKNINAFSKLIRPNFKIEDISINGSLFGLHERNAINLFLQWDNREKNNSIYSLVSYSLEYSVVSNNISSNSFLEKSLKNKIFYLDNNVIYRAIGINGENRKNRIRTFLKKCMESGSKFYISKYTIKEFSETIDYHINQLQRVPFGKINPSLFRQYAVNPGMYEFYHTWRENRTTYYFKLFRAHLQDMYHKFIREFNVIEDCMSSKPFRHFLS